jgi:putative ABC transport system ATP-binding protein
MVTHDPVAAAHTDRVVFLADGRVVDELREPVRETVLSAMTRMDAPLLDSAGPDGTDG